MSVPATSRKGTSETTVEVLERVATISGSAEKNLECDSGMLLKFSFAIDNDFTNARMKACRSVAGRTAVSSCPQICKETIDIAATRPGLACRCKGK